MSQNRSEQSGDTVRTHIEIPRNVWEQFKTIVMLKHGSAKGHLQQELTNALRLYIKTEMAKFQPKRKFEEFLKEIGIEVD